MASWKDEFLGPCNPCRTITCREFQDFVKKIPDFDEPVTFCQPYKYKTYEGVTANFSIDNLFGPDVDLQFIVIHKALPNAIPITISDKTGAIESLGIVDNVTNWQIKRSFDSETPLTLSGFNSSVPVDIIVHYFTRYCDDDGFDGDIIDDLKNKLNAEIVKNSSQQSDIDILKQQVTELIKSGGGSAIKGEIRAVSSLANVPAGWAPYDLAAGKVLIGVQAGKYIAGNSYGEEKVTLKAGEIPEHYHDLYSKGYGLSGYVDGIRLPQVPFGEPPLVEANRIGKTQVNGRGDSGYTAGQPHNNIQPSLAVYYIIKL